MYLKVTMTDGSTALTALSPSHTLRVIDPGDNTAAAWAVGGIQSISFEQGDIVTGTDAPPPPGGSEADPNAPVSPTEPAYTGLERRSGPVTRRVATVATTPDRRTGADDRRTLAGAAAASAAQQLVPTPVADSMIPAGLADQIVPAAGVLPPIQDPVVLATPPDAAPADPAHDVAVAAIAPAVLDLVTAPPADTPKKAATQADTIAALNADVDAALAQWPDSPQLQDAKAQLGTLAGELPAA